MKCLWSAGALARADRTQPRAAALHGSRFRFRTQNTVSALLFPRALHSPRNDDLGSDLLVDGRDVVMAAAVVELADYRRLPALHHPHDSAFGASIRPDGTQLQEYLVAVHGIADGRRRNENVAGQLAAGPGRQRVRLGKHKTVAFAMHPQLADYQVMAGDRRRQAPSLLAYGDKLTPPGHLPEKTLDLPAVPAFNPKVVDDLLKTGDVPGLLADVVEEFFFSNH